MCYWTYLRDPTHTGNCKSTGLRAMLVGQAGTRGRSANHFANALVGTVRDGTAPQIQKASLANETRVLNRIW